MSDNWIVQNIQNALDTKTFNVNLGGTINELATTLNTSADNIRTTFVDVIKEVTGDPEYKNSTLAKI